MESSILKYKEILSKLRSTRRKETLLLFALGFLKVFSVLAISFLIVSLIELIGNGDSVFRGSLAILSLAFILISVILFLVPPLMRWAGIKNKPSLENIALRVGEHYPELKDKLCNVIQLVDKFETRNHRRPDNTSKDLAIAAFNKVSQLSENKNYNVILDKNNYKKMIFYFSISLLALILNFGVFNNSLGASFYRVSHFNESFIPPPPFSIIIQPQDSTILRTHPILIRVIASGDAPKRLSVYLKEKQQKRFDEYTLRLDSLNTYYYEIPSLKESISIYGEADWMGTSVRTAIAKIKVIDKPFIRSLIGKVIYPKYTKLPSKQLNERTAGISALVGSRVQLGVLANKGLKSAEIIIETRHLKREVINENIQNDSIVYDTTYQSMRIDEQKAIGNFTIRNSGIYYINLIDSNNQHNDDPIKYEITATKDDNPTISLIEPITNVQVTEEAILPIRLAIADDYGFSTLNLHYRLIKSRYSEPETKFSSIKIPIVSNELAQEIPYIWNLNDVNIAPDDMYEYYLEVFDNDIVSGPKSSKTQNLIVKLPSLDEVLNETDKQNEKIDKQLQDVLKQARQVKKELKDLNQELLKKQNKKNIDWKDKKKADEIVKKQQDLQKKMNDIQKNLENMTKNLKNNNALSKETLQKYKELQKLMSEVNSPELQKMQENLQRAMKQLSPEKIQEAMKKVKFDEEKFRKSIERTMKILKRLQAEQKVDALKKRADELEAKQNELKKATKNANPKDKAKKDQLAKKQKTIKEDFKKMSEELKKLEKLMKELGDMPMEDLEKAKQSLNQKETQKEMQNAMKNLKNGNFNQSQKSQKKASSNMKKFSQQMQSLKDAMQEKGIKEAIRKMQKSISDLLKLSNDQEKLKAKTKSMDYNSTQFKQLLSQQLNINQGLANTINNMMALAQKSFAVTPQMASQLGNAMQQMQNALNQMAERNIGKSSQAQAKAMSSMNQAVLSMQGMLAQMQKSKSCSNPNGQGPGSSGKNGKGGTPLPDAEGFMKQLQQLANQQQGINSAMQQMAGSQGSLTMEQQAQMSRLAAQQEQVQQSIQKLSEQQHQIQNRDGKKIGLGNLEKIAKEMKETISDLKNGNIRPKTLKRQERILSRLLDATRSIHERDRENTRESEVGVDRNRKSPNQIDFSTQEGKTRALQELLKSIQQGYTKDYESLIRRYFEKLQSDKSEINN